MVYSRSELQAVLLRLPKKWSRRYQPFPLPASSPLLGAGVPELFWSPHRWAPAQESWYISDISLGDGGSFLPAILFAALTQEVAGLIFLTWGFSDSTKLLLAPQDVFHT